MKGLNRYARFCDDPGIEKLLTINQAKRSFLMPVTLSFSQLEPFRLRATAGLLACPSDMVMQSGPAVASFSRILARTRGRQSGADIGLSSVSRAGHRLFLFSTYCRLWSVPFLQLGVRAPHSGRPLLFSLRNVWRAVVGSLPGLRIQKFHYCPATVLFCVGLILLSGRLAVMDPLRVPVRNAGHSFFVGSC